MGKTYRKPETIEATVIGETENNLKLKDITRWLTGLLIIKKE